MTLFDNMIKDHVNCFNHLSRQQEAIVAAAEALAGVIRTGGRVFICGNGGSAADAQHFAAELVGRFERDGRALPALALTTDTSVLTAVANDYGYDEVFARQLQGLACSADALIGLSASGNSANVGSALRAAASKGLTRVLLTGKGGGRFREEADYVIEVPADSTARVQEAHIFILHYFVMVVEQSGLRENRS